MRCDELLSALNEYLDGDTRSALCQALQEHLANCNSCRVVIDNIRQTITLYRVGEASPLPAGLHEKNPLDHARALGRQVSSRRRRRIARECPIPNNFPARLVALRANSLEYERQMHLDIMEHASSGWQEQR